VPLELSYHRRRRIFTLNFAPWISEKTFRKAYRKCQKVVQGGDNRRMKERTLAVMRFVTEHTDDEGKRLLELPRSRGRVASTPQPLLPL
jgi:hypothetical protein